MEKISLTKLRELAANEDYDGKDHEYMQFEEAIKTHDWKLFLIDDKYIAITLYATTYLTVNGIGHKRIDNNCYGGVTYKGNAEGICLPKELISEIMKIYPNYKINGWDYKHDNDINRPYKTYKIIPHKYMYRDIVNIIDDISLL